MTTTTTTYTTIETMRAVVAFADACQHMHDELSEAREIGRDENGLAEQLAAMLTDQGGFFVVPAHEDEFATVVRALVACFTR